MSRLFKGLAVVSLFGLLMLSACTPDDSEDPGLSYEEQLAIDIEIIDDYLTANNISAEVDANSGLRYVIHEQGTGDAPTINDNVVVAYEGRLLRDGAVFDESDSFEFPLNRLIRGWQIGLPKINEGGSMTLYIPSGLGYGPSGNGGIPANANIIFNIDLLDVP